MPRGSTCVVVVGLRWGQSLRPARNPRLHRLPNRKGHASAVVAALVLRVPDAGIALRIQRGLAPSWRARGAFKNQPGPDAWGLGV